MKIQRRVFLAVARVYILLKIDPPFLHLFKNIFYVFGMYALRGVNDLHPFGPLFKI